MKKKEPRNVKHSTRTTDTESIAILKYADDIGETTSTALRKLAIDRLKQLGKLQ
ncbi:hypothetical protein ACFFHM_03230 [Halalkalibacter kiskunsagensis]|uniref:CopG family transcriptional regulator n=1 Tax=Halalkalibacter kiskunsagensis TaxID=1548599 RepID=A0ABV6K8D2_9BACI